MRKNNKYIICYSLLGGMVATGAVAGIRVGNLSRNYAGTYKNVTGVEQQYYNSIADTQPMDEVYVAPELPIPVANVELADKIRSGDADAPADVETLNTCAMIYPDGEFVWDRPTMGRGAGGSPTCVAVVEMRALGANGNLEYSVAARGKLAAGDMINCNISDFPTSTYLPDITRVTFPADSAPTREDVIRVLNEEQKNNAGIKIAAATVAAGIAGNMVGKSAVGSDHLFGTNSEKMKTTAAGAAIGAALMTASTYSGKVAGDVILHTSVNAAAGGIIGNMYAAGESVVRVEKCNDGGAETTCLWGTIVKTSKDQVQGNVYYTPKDSVICLCDDSDKNCHRDNSLIIKNIIGKDDKEVSMAQIEEHGTKMSSVLEGAQTYYISGHGGCDDGNMLKADGSNGEYYKATAAKRAGMPVPAVVVGFKDSAFGVKLKDWRAWQSANRTGARLCMRDSHGNPYDCNLNDDEGNALYTLDDFNPVFIGADDGGVIDFSNKARMESTLKGAGAGGVLGGFSGYQGAQNDIEERFVQATREYNDSLEKFYCGTGRKWLSYYNDETMIPQMKK